MDLKFGIIGFGKIGRMRKEIIERLRLGTVVAISDPYADISGCADSCITSKHFEDVLKADINCVVVATPNNITADAVIRSLEAGKHVFSEKPPARNLQETLAIKAIAENFHHLKLKFGFNHRCHASVINAHNILKSGNMGDLMWARGFYGKSGGVNFANEWRSNKEVAGGGILLDQGIHMADLLLHFMGDFQEVKSFVTNYYWNIPLEDNAFAILRNNRGQVAMLHSSSTQWKHLFRLELFFKEGYMILSGLMTSSRSYGRETLIIARRQFEDAGNPGEEEIFYDNDRSFEIEMADFRNCVVNDVQVTNGSIEDAVRVMDLIDRMYHADDQWNMNQ
jgi:predicted dehydrogenase